MVRASDTVRAARQLGRPTQLGPRACTRRPRTHLCSAASSRSKCSAKRDVGRRHQGNSRSGDPAAPATHGRHRNTADQLARRTRLRVGNRRHVCGDRTRTQSSASSGFATSRGLHRGHPDVSAAALRERRSPSARTTDYWPLTLYDTREGRSATPRRHDRERLALGGVMHYVELDVNNLRRWLLGAIGDEREQAPTTRQRLHRVFLRSPQQPQCRTRGDRRVRIRGHRQPATVAGTPNDPQRPGRDVNGNGVFDTYGDPVAATHPPGPCEQRGRGLRRASPRCLTEPIRRQPASSMVATANSQVFFRRALKIVNGGTDAVPAPGLTIASENPVYVQGNYNATDGEPARGRSARARGHHRRRGDAPVHRVERHSIVQFTERSGWTPGPNHGIPHGHRRREKRFRSRSRHGATADDFGTDGGAHNFLRYLEEWETAAARR